MDKEYIVAAAIHQPKAPEMGHKPRNIEKGFVVTGFNHAVCHEIMTKLGIPKPFRVHGFITSKNRFVEREEAKILAIASDQLKYVRTGSDLYSEDLYFNNEKEEIPCPELVVGTDAILEELEKNDKREVYTIVAEPFIFRFSPNSEKILVSNVEREVKATTMNIEDLRKLVATYDNRKEEKEKML